MADAAAADAEAGANAPGPNAISDEEVSALLENPPAGQVRSYDLMARRINRTQLPMLETVCRLLAERKAAALSSLVGRDATVQFTALDSVRAGELQAALPVPGCLVTVRLKPLPGVMFVSVDPGLLLVLLDGFFGGTGRAANDTQAAVAPAALRFLSLILRNFAVGMTAAWAPVLPVELEIVKQETNPRLMNLGAAQDAMLALRFTVEFGTRSGRIDWLMPEAMVEPIRETLTGEAAETAAAKQATWAPVLGSVLQDAKLETRAVLAQAQISLGELVRLTPGDIIPIEAPQQVTLLAGEVPLYRGRFGVSQGRNAIKIQTGGRS
jgi:flagellar motor switch protein FliM